MPSFVRSLNADDAKICQKGEEGQAREREKSRQRGEGKVGEGRMSAGGADRKLGHEENRNEECGLRGVIDFVIFPPSAL